MSSSLPLLVGGVVDRCAVSVGKADLLSDQSDLKQSREPIDLPLTWYPSSILTTFEFMSSEVRLSC